MDWMRRRFMTHAGGGDLGGDAGGAVVGVALERLDAAQRKHLPG